MTVRGTHREGRLLGAGALLGVMVLLGACPPPAEGEGEGEGEGEPGPGVLEATPTSCAFGVVPIGTTASCDVVLRNRGAGPLTVDSAVVSGAPFVVGAFSPLEILPGGVDFATVTVAASPNSAAAASGTLTLTSTNASVLEVPLSAATNPCPTAIIAVLKNGAAVPSPATAFLTDDVVLDASPSTPGIPSGSVTTFAWSVLSQPAGGSLALTAPSAASTSLTGRFLGRVDVGLQVFDNQGALSCNTAEVTLVTVPRLNVKVGDALLVGLEPHVFRNDGERCGALDCFDTAGCGFLASAPPPWDAVVDQSDGDPRFDEVEGVAVGAPIDGTYTVGVYGRTVAATEDAAVTISLDGAPTAQTRTLGDGDFWTVARVTFAGAAAPAITLVDTLETGVACP